MELSARATGLLSLLAIIPVVVYAVGRADLGVAIAVVNVLAIGACLFVAFSSDDARIARSLSG